MKLLKNLSWIFTANIFVSFTKWLIIILIAKYLSPEEVGKYSLAFAISAPITLFANMKLRSLYITEDSPVYTDYSKVRNMFSAISLTLLMLLSILIYPHYFWVIMIVGMSKVLDLQSDMYYAIPHKNNELNRVAKVMIIKHLLTLGVFFIVLLLTYNLLFSLIIQVLVQLFYLLFVERKMFLSKAASREKERTFFSVNGNTKSIIALGLPLGLVQMLVSINTSLPRYFLELFESLEVLGYFSAIMYIVTLGNMLMNAISQIVLPLMSNLYNNSNIKSFKSLLYLKLTGCSLIIGFLLITFTLVFGEYLLTLIYSEDYAEYTHLLLLLSIALGINFISWNFDTALLSIRYISIQPKISIFSLIINIFLSYYFIKIYGVTGAAYALISVNFIQLILRIYFVDKRIKIVNKAQYE